jgi:GNAT superfamily N-acetyltransferase
MQATASFDLIELETQHIREAHRLSAQESWPHRPADWSFLLELSRGFGAMSDGRLLGTAIFTPYGTQSGTCNMIIVDPSARGTSLGRQLMQAALDCVGDRECRLIATEAGRPLYERLGFVATGRITQYQGVSAKVEVFPNVTLATPNDLNAIVALDLARIGMDRRGLLNLLLRDGQILLLREGADLLGYVSLRQFGHGQLIGPLVAKDNTTAANLLRAGIARCAGQFLRFDLTEAAADFGNIVVEAGLGRINTGLAMTRPAAQPSAATGAAQVYALASQALG